MIRILLMNNAYPTKANPGYAAFIPGIRDCLAAAGFKVDLLVMDSDNASFIGKYLAYVKYYVRVFFFGKYKEYDYVYINMFPYSFLPLIIHFHKMKNVVIHWHGSDVFPESLFANLLSSLSYKFIKDRFIHIAPSNNFAHEASEKLKIRVERFFVSPSGGIDMKVFEARDHRSKTPGLIRLGFASALLQLKGMDLVLQLLGNIERIEKQLNCKIEFHFIEYGKEKKKYIEVLSSFPNVIKHSPYPLHKMAEFYYGIDILLFPSLRESLGLVALEAMACNVPVIATDAFAFKETVTTGVSGERFAINDFTSFSEALAKCIDQLDRYAPREFIQKHYSKQSVIEKYKLLFH